MTPAPRTDAVDEAAAPATVVFVGGMPRSGSTLLDLMVGQLPGHCDVGELFYLWISGPTRNQICACGEPFDACGFWTRVGQVAFGGWDRVDVERVLELQRRVDATARLPLLWLASRPTTRWLVGRLRPTYRAEVSEYLGVVHRVYRAVAQVAGADVVVDSTKRPSTAYLLASDRRFDLAVAHVVRDPRGVVSSWSKEVALPAGAAPRDHLKKRPLTQTLRRWWSVNAMIHRLGRRVPLTLVRYEDLVTDPRSVMRDVLALTGREPGASDLDFLGADGLRTGVSHAPTGGRVRFRTGPMPLVLDEKWRRELPVWKQRVTVVICRPLMRRYGYR